MKLKRDPLCRSDDIYTDDDHVIGKVYYPTEEDMKLFRVAFYDTVIAASSWQNHKVKSRERMLRHRNKNK